MYYQCLTGSHGPRGFGHMIAIDGSVVRNTKLLEENNMAKSAKKSKLTSKKLEKKAPLSLGSHTAKP
jgi:hypothetical protein